MRLGGTVICGISMLAFVSGAAVTFKNECECSRKVMKASPLPPPDFTSVKHCEETNPTDLHPIKDICSCIDVAQVRPACNPLDDVPKFAQSTSCECGYDECKPAPKKYPADVISQHLAAVAARRKTISETDLHFHGPPMKVAPCPKEVLTVPEEKLYKLNRPPIELKPPKKKYIPRVDLSEEEQQPCQPEKQQYSEICYGKIEAPVPELEEVKQEEIPCQVCTDTHVSEATTECPCVKEVTEEGCEEDEEYYEEEEDTENTDDGASEDCDEEESCADSDMGEDYRKRSIRPDSLGKRKMPKAKN